jgi:uncharacterized protein YjiS (DUF1127 family)
MSRPNLHIAGSSYDATPSNELKSASAAAIATGSSFIMKALAEFLRYRAFLKAEKQLMDLDDRMLKDIGLDRSEIRSALVNARQERLNGSHFPSAPSC